jgi:FkbM family methyltransferase
MSRSQGDEERCILDYFKDTPHGRFLDCGAYNFNVFSNVRALADRGWGGVLVEPSPAACAGLLKDTAAYPNVTVVNAAVASEAGWHTFQDSGGDAVGTLSASHAELWGGAVNYRPLNLWAVTVGQLLHRFPPPYAFVNLDVEGCNLAILERLPIAWMGALSVCVEHEGKVDKVRELCGEHGLTLELYRSGENIILGK